MTTTINKTRSTQVENLTPQSGNEASEVENASILGQTITLSTEEEVTAALSAHTMESLTLLCDQAVGVQVLETRFAILQTVAGPPGTVDHTGDLEQEIYPGDLVRIEDTADDGVYLVATVVEALGTTTITFENGQSLPFGGGGPVGTVARVANTQRIGYAYAIATSTQATGAIVIVGNVTDKFSELDYLQIQGTVGNDGMWEIDADPTYAAPNTTIIVNQVPGGAVGLPATEGPVGTITRILPSIQLAANVPFLWSVEGGLQNPFINPQQVAGEGPLWDASRGQVVAFMVDNTLNAVAAEFKGTIAKNSDIF